jgi:hypothetical protein
LTLTDRSGERRFQVLSKHLAARRNLGVAEGKLRDTAKAARDAGDSWTIIGTALDISRQAAQQRFGTS